MRSVYIIFCSCLIIFLTVGSAVSMAYGQARVSQRNIVHRAFTPLAWSYPTKNSYSFPGCTSARIELKTKGGRAPVTIEYDGVIYSSMPITITKQGSRTYLMVPPKLPNHTMNIQIKATDAQGTVIRKEIRLNVTAPFIKPIQISSVNYNTYTAKDNTYWMIDVQADYEIVPGAGVPGFRCTPNNSLKYENLEYIAEYQNGFKYKAGQNSIPDINKGSVVKYFIKYDGGQSNKVTVSLPKRIYKYKEKFRHEEAAAALMGRTPKFTGTDIIRLPNYSNGKLIRGQTGCGKNYLTYEKAYVSQKTFAFPGAIMGSYNASLSKHPQKGQIINLSNRRIKFDWHHLGSGLIYTATVEAQARQGICAARRR